MPHHPEERLTVAQPWKRHSSHWGVFDGHWLGDALCVRPYAGDPDPNPLIDNFPGAVRHAARIAEPVVRRGWLEHGPGPDSRRGKDEFVRVPWNQVLDILARDLQRVKKEYGTAGIFGGSYGWASAGRFHHAQSQLHRFLNCALGGYVRSVHSYSSGAAQVVLPHVLGDFDDLTLRNVTWDQVVEHTDVVLAFGGMALKNSRVAAGGVARHIERSAMAEATRRGCRFYNLGPIKGDLPEEAHPAWIPVIPGTDVAFMLAVAHTLVERDLHDKPFINRYCDGWEVFRGYLMGESDGIAKDAKWAAPISGISARDIIDLALSLVGRRVLITVAHSLQRAQHGEQPVWMGVVLAALLGQPGLPGGGYNYALGSIAKYGRRRNAVPVAALPQGVNHELAFIPCARVADMLLQPGEKFNYNGSTLTYPHVRFAYWVGGSPFHHHQDLGRLTEAIQRLETFVVHDFAWTATAKHADIVLPCTMTLEREDVGGTPTDPILVAMQRIVEPIGEARDDYDIFCDLAQRMGCWSQFSEERSSNEWLRALYSVTEQRLGALGMPAPDFEEFWKLGELTLPQGPDSGGKLRSFRENSVASPLPTKSGRIQLASENIASFGYADCPGHPAWIPSTEPATAEYPLYLIANQPSTRLHSQLDFGGHSLAQKRGGREVCRLHGNTARARGIADGDIVRIYSPRGSCLASARLSADLREDVIRLPTGAWYDPDRDERGLPMCVHGNPNVLTRDVGTSSLAQGCIGQLTAVQVERYLGPLRPVWAHTPPKIVG